MCRLSDLVNLNPGASSLRPGASVEVPCYPPEEPFKFGYYGGDVAFGLVRRVLAALPACLPACLHGDGVGAGGEDGKASRMACGGG